ncbi:MAG: hypothetical protein IEMM0007_0190 [bacterium]|nr:MAG: hypothetical protein IEMM0007_0190 [bacterium]
MKQIEFCIADTFTDSLAKLTGEEQKGNKDYNHAAGYYAYTKDLTP